MTKKDDDQQIGKAVGISVSGVIASKLLSLGYGFVLGGGGVAAFFPDTCELAAFTIKTSSIDAPDVDFDDLDDEDWWESGILVSVGLSVEVARYFGGSGNPGEASAKSFEGPFHTGMLGVGGTTLSLYYSNKNYDDPDARWVGGTVGILGPGAGAGIMDWQYELVPSLYVDLDAGSGVEKLLGQCLCRILVLLTPELAPLGFSGVL